MAANNNQMISPQTKQKAPFFSQDNSIIIGYFHMEGCHHCTELHPLWDTMINEKKNGYDVVENGEFNEILFSKNNKIVYKIYKIESNHTSAFNKFLNNNKINVQVDVNKGFPNLFKITKKDNVHSIEYYDGPRNSIKHVEKMKKFFFVNHPIIKKDGGKKSMKKSRKGCGCNKSTKKWFYWF